MRITWANRGYNRGCVCCCTSVSLALFCSDCAILPFHLYIFSVYASTDRSVEILRIVLTDLAIIHLDENAPKKRKRAQNDRQTMSLDLQNRVSCTEIFVFLELPNFFDESHQFSNKGTPQNGRKQVRTLGSSSSDWLKSVAKLIGCVFLPQSKTNTHTHTHRRGAFSN